MMKKVIPVMALALCLAFVFSTVAMAAVKPSDSIQWDSRAKCTPTLSISGTTATCKLFVNAASSSDAITATVILQKSNGDGTYTGLKTWSKMTGKGTLSFVDTYSPVGSGSYRLKAMIYVTGGSGTDSITKFAYATK